MSSKKIILLDLGGVVFESTGFSNSKIDWEIVEKLNDKYGEDMNLGLTELKQFLNEYNEITKQSLSANDFLEGIFDTLNFNEELITYLKKNFLVYIVSDNYRENIEYISKRFKFNCWSAGSVYSYEHGMTKKKPNFFEIVLKQLNLNAEDCILIDDRELNIKNAKTVGIKSFIFINNTQIFNKLSRFIVLK